MSYAPALGDVGIEIDDVGHGEASLRGRSCDRVGIGGADATIYGKTPQRRRALAGLT